MKITMQKNTNSSVADHHAIKRGSIIALIIPFAIAFLLTTSGLQTYWSARKSEK